MTPSHAMPSPNRPHAPVLVLGSHRSGTSAVMGLLARAGGLELGDVMPATKANAKGYFESVAIVKAHNQLLAALDRDWTCPPASFDPQAVPTAGLATEVARLEQCGKPWGIKDPRLLYMLPVWSELVPEMRFVGVIRDHEEVVRSLQERDGLDPGVADTITRAYVRRLNILRERFEFPVIDVSVEPQTVLRRTADVAVSLGLDWDEAAAKRFFDPSMIKRRARGLLTNQDVDSLRVRCEGSTSPARVSSEALGAVLDEFAKDPDDFDRYSGPRHNARRAMAWAAVPRELPTRIELTRNLRAAASLNPVPDGSQAVQCSDLESFYVAVRKVAPPADAVVLPDITSWLRRDELSAAFTLIHEHLGVDGILIVGLADADADTQRIVGREPITADEIRAVASAAGFFELPRAGNDQMCVWRFCAVASTRTLLRAVFAGGGAKSAPAGRQRVAPPALPTTPTSHPDELFWKFKYDRLVGRRSVKFALALATRSRPLFRFARRAKERLRRND